MALTSGVSVSLTGTLTSALDLSTGSAPLTVRRAAQFASGTGAGQADLIFSDRRTLAASASESLDLAGVLLDAFGATLTFVKIKGLYISAADANINTVVVGAAASTPWATLLSATGTVTLRPGSFLGVGVGAADATGYAVTASTADLLKITNGGSGTSVSYDIAIIGTSA